MKWNSYCRFEFREKLGGFDFGILENFQVTGTLTHIEGQGSPIVVPNPKGLVPFPTLTASQSTGHYRKVVIGKLSCRAHFNMLHHRRFRVRMFGNSDCETPFGFSYIHLLTFTGVFVDKIAARKHLTS